MPAKNAQGWPAAIATPTATATTPMTRWTQPHTVVSISKMYFGSRDQDRVVADR